MARRRRPQRTSGRDTTSARRQAAGLDLDDRAFLAGLRSAADRMKVRSERHLLSLGYQVQGAARRFAPVDTGRLRSSILVVPGRDSRGYYVEVGTRVAYAPYVEYGTRHSGAQPFLRPALLQVVRSAGQ